MTRSPSPSLLVQSWCWISRCLWLSGLSLSWSGAAIAQLIPDRTLPQPTQVNTTVSPTGNTDQITGGTQTGSNLFHSFSEFSIPTNHAAIFNNAADVQNIITRVTGRSPSQIDGLIRANGNANLFLLNPNGIQLGRNARLGIGGSFIGSTAEQIEFSDGFRFSAMNPESSSLLTVSVPVGLQFGDRPSSILVQGSGNGFRINPETFTINDNQHDSGFQVRSGQTLALIGGDLRFIGGNLTASGGRVELGSVQGAGTVRLTPIATGWTLDYSGIDQFGRIQLSQAASVDTRGDRGGDIQVQARRLVLTEGSTLLANTQGARQGGNLTVNTTEAVQILGVSTDPASNTVIFPSSLYADVEPGASGNGGNLSIRTGLLRVAAGGQVSASTFGSGNTGNLRINAQRVDLLSGAPVVGGSGLFANVNDSSATGSAGRLQINTQQLRVLDGATVSASTFGQGNAGNLQVNAQSVQISGASPNGFLSGLFAQVEEGATGQGGRLSVRTDELQLTDGGRISTSTLGSGSAGLMTIQANRADFAGSATAGDLSGLFAFVETGASGQGGSISLQANRLQLADGARVTASTSGDGAAGEVRIRAGEMTLIGASPAGDASAVLTTVSPEATGRGGSLTITADQLQLVDGGQIAVATAGSGDAGNLLIRANAIVLEGSSEFGRSGLFASAVIGTGAGGNIAVRSDRLSVQSGATISASNFSSRNPNTPPGQGAAGNIRVTARLLSLDNDGSITASTAVEERGNIGIRAEQVLMSQMSVIATDARGREPGGNITLNTRFLTASGNSDITANAANARGGRVVVNAENVFGTTFRLRQTPLSDITASSELGVEFNGVVELNSPEIDPTQGIEALPETLIDSASQIARACDRASGNTFVATGRGGLPTDTAIGQLGASTMPWSDIRIPEPASVPNLPSDAVPSAAQPHSQDAFTEAQGWTQNDQGEVRLIATVAQARHNHIATFCPQ